MKYTREQRLDIAKRVYDGELNVEEAAVNSSLNPSSVKGYLRLYRAETELPPRTCGTERAGRRLGTSHSLSRIRRISVSKNNGFPSKEEIIDALVMARIKEARLKKATQ